MHRNEQIVLSKYRLEKSGEMIEEAEILFENKRYKGSNNRSYYAILHALRAVLALYVENLKEFIDRVYMLNRQQVS